MHNKEFLEKVRELLCEFSWWDESAYHALLDLDDSDVISENVYSYKVTFLLEKIYEYSRIIDYIVDDEINELIALTDDETIVKLENVVRIAVLCKKYVNEIEENDILTMHPICKCYDSQDYMYLTEDMFIRF